jgi:hypothetical protein
MKTLSWRNVSRLIACDRQCFEMKQRWLHVKRWYPQRRTADVFRAVSVFDRKSGDVLAQCTQWIFRSPAYGVESYCAKQFEIALCE